MLLSDMPEALNCSSSQTGITTPAWRSVLNVFEPNVQRILQSIGPNDVVLDIGGWACPFNRANYILDVEPYETRGFYQTIGGLASQGGDQEYFTKKTWIVQDLCGRKPYPFRDKEIDFVICSHTLEDLRDPLWVCSEMVRIAKRGYIEVPSRLAESCRGWEYPEQVGLSHHRWLVTINDNSIEFLMKYHLIHTHWRFSLPFRYFKILSDEKKVQWLFWENSFNYAERMLHGMDAQVAELETFVAGVHPYSRWRLSADRKIRGARNLVQRMIGKAKRILNGSMRTAAET